MRINKIKRIVIHCTAGFGDLPAIKHYWHKVLKWKTGGYHIVIDLHGVPHVLYPFTKVVNGVKGFNSSSIHISYIGGVSPDNYREAKDTRNVYQKIALENAINQALDWVDNNGGDASKIQIVGHRDLSPDTNRNGKVDSWERIKECPSFNASPEYKKLLRS